MDIERYIKDLPSDLQEKARACGNVKELLALAQEEGVPVPDDALSAIAAGSDNEAADCKKVSCTKCGSGDIKILSMDMQTLRRQFHCNSCGYEWYDWE